MNDIIYSIITTLLTAVILPLISLLGAKLIKLINTKIDNNETSKMLETASLIVMDAVRMVCQTYVETLKGKDAFDVECQKIALTKAKNIALSQMTDKMKDYITMTYGNLDEWLVVQIESSINYLKNKW